MGHHSSFGRPELAVDARLPTFSTTYQLLPYTKVVSHVAREEMMPRVEYVESGIRIVAAHKGAVWPLVAACLPGHKASVLSTSGEWSEEIHRWDALAGDLLCTYDEINVPASSFAVSPSGNGGAVLAAGTESGVHCWNFETGEHLFESAALHGSTIWDVTMAALPTGRTLLLGAGADDRIYRWDAATGEPLGDALIGHCNSVKSVLAFRGANGRMTVASGDDNGAVLQWDAQSGELLNLESPEFDSMVTTLAHLTLADGRILLVGGSPRGEVRCWDATTGESIGRPINTGGGLPTLAAVVTRGEPRIYTSRDDDVIAQWNALTGELVDESPTGLSLAAVQMLDGDVLLATGTGEGDIFARRIGA
ncbi:WD40 repeat domain-containing protein [Kitasatospora sp. NBC_01287]|uniref:WD40 repeat domain-containing protein n=1 Tax=Kitasatospora sp. NBC_01287 TaxID=2903573 RepID=UPI002259CD98|nr:WD40 repeat domain-containing protein [Kitasatospora sp. NBC_01287]MCX4749214.1 WD40 repeat domain-containing protein [Kitasatospora sp. NBC_01287]